MKDPLTTLPTEVLFKVFSLLDPVSLCLFSRISKAWKSVVESDLLWHIIATHHGYDAAPCYISSDGSKKIMTSIASTLEQHLISTNSDHQGTAFEKILGRCRQASMTGYFDDCDSFKKLCCKLWMLECNWSGRDTYETRTNLEASYCKTLLPVTLKPKIRRLIPEGETFDVWKFKLDPVERTIIATGFRSGVTVFDRDTFQVLWRIDHAKSKSHLEFSNGYMVFDCIGLGNLEVHQSERLVVNVDDLQQPRRGHFCHLKSISMDDPIQAFRLQYPYLAVTSTDSTISFFELPSCQLAKKFSFRNSPHRDGNVNYIDFDDEYLFMVGTGAHAVSAFSRETGELVWNMGQHFASGHAGPSTWYSDGCKEPPFVEMVTFLRRGLKSRIGSSCWQEYPHWHQDWARPSPEAGYYQIWSAIHPDIKTRTLCILGQGTLVMLRDYKTFFRDTSKKPDMFAEIEFIDLTEEDEWNDVETWDRSYDAQLTVHDGKAFIVNGAPMIVDLENPGPTCTCDSENRAGPCQFTFYNHPQPYVCPPPVSPAYLCSFCSCVQMNQTGAYYVETEPRNMIWEGYDAKREIQHFDFTQRDGVLLGQIRELNTTVVSRAQEATMRGDWQRTADNWFYEYP